MKKLLIRITLLTLAAFVVVLLHKQVQKEAMEREALSAAGPAVVPEEEQQQGLPVLRLGDGVTLGRVETDPEGGIVISVPERDGSETAYRFTDVQPESWYVSAIDFVVSAGLMGGAGDEPVFHPEYGVPRESFAEILYRFAHGESGEQPHSHFDDVPEDSAYLDAVDWVTGRRIMTGLSGSSFGVGEFMTCEQAIIALYRLAGSPKTDGSLLEYPYAAKVTASGRNAVDWAWKNGLITEDECVWYPSQALSRAQAALLLMRYSMLPATSTGT